MNRNQFIKFVRECVAEHKLKTYIKKQIMESISNQLNEISLGIPKSSLTRIQSPTAIQFDVDKKNGEGTEEVDEVFGLKGFDPKTLPPDELHKVMRDQLRTAKEKAMEDAPYQKLKRQAQKAEKERFEKDKFGTPLPMPIPDRPLFIHSNLIKLIGKKDENGNIIPDLDRLKDMIMTRPTELLKRNTKIGKSGKRGQGEDTREHRFFDLGLPALKALVVDEHEKGMPFFIINTCPGAGECKIYCYARKGGYVQWSNVALTQTRTINYLVNEPVKFFEALSNELQSKLNSFKNRIKLVFRWHDAGDFFSPDYFGMAIALANKFPDIDFYAYTKVASVANSSLKPSNLITNFSFGATEEEQSQIDFKKSKHALVVKSALFERFINRLDNDAEIDAAVNKVLNEIGDASLTTKYTNARNSKREKDIKHTKIFIQVIGNLTRLKKADVSNVHSVSDQELSDKFNKAWDANKTGEVKLIIKEIRGLAQLRKIKTVSFPQLKKWIEFKSPEALKLLKNEMSLRYSSPDFPKPPESFISYEEMMGKPVGPIKEWNVIVKSGDGDDAANRPDVLGTYLFIH